MKRYASRGYKKGSSGKKLLSSFSVGGSYSEDKKPAQESAIVTGMLTGLGAYVSVELFKMAFSAGKNFLDDANRELEIEQVSRGRSSYPR